ncbi:MAG TPA: tetratricopeptide repeat protein [Tepidisphaeraceae bacterium]|jgi:tetratricopeptide (TPR) repeat protein
MSAPEVVNLVQAALQQHLGGNVAQAEQMYRQALAQEPNQADGLHLLGVLLAQRSEFDAAVPLLKKAVAILPNIAEFHRHLADVYALTDRAAEALDGYRTAIRLDPRDVNALYGAARAAAATNQDGESANFLAAVVNLDPNNHSAWSDLGVVLTRQGNFSKAIEVLQRSLALNPNSGHALTAMSDALRQEGRIDQALEPARRGAESQPDNAWAQIAYGNVLQMLARFEEAAEYYKKAMVLEPNNFDAINNLALTLLKMGRPDEAMHWWERAAEKWPEDPNMKANRSLGLLTLGELERGFAEYESRFASQAFKGSLFPEKPRWNGEDVGGKVVLLNSEQGVGDTIQFVRYVPMLAQRGARILIVCPPEVKELLKTIRGAERVLSRGDEEPVFDLWFPMVSFPYVFKTTLDRVPADVPYLSADPARVARWRKRFAGESRLKVGIVWAGSPQHQNDRARSARLEDFAPLARIEGVRLYSLQKGQPTAALKQVPFEVTPLGDELSDFSETAAAIEALDLTISVDTSVVHLAGALARPVWTLLAYGPDFRWMLNREDTPWYPTMRLLRQPKLHDWTGLMVRVEAELRSKAAEHAEKTR